MVTTTWIAGSGDWGTGSNWTAGVPGTNDTAVFPVGGASYTVSGSGSAAVLQLDASSGGHEPTLAGTFALGTLSGAGFDFPELTGTLSSPSLTLSHLTLTLEPGASLGSGALTLAAGATLAGTLGLLTNAITLPGTGTITGSGTSSGAISGSGGLDLYGGSLTLSGASTFSGGTVLYGGSLELEGTTAAGSGPLAVVTGTLTLDAGAQAPVITAGINNGYGVVTAVDADVLVFGGTGSQVVQNGSGRSTVIGATTPQQIGTDYNESPIGFYPNLQVQGGTGSVTVFGGNAFGRVFGGTAGHDVLVGGTDLTGYTELGSSGIYTSATGTVETSGMTIGGGGDGDLLVATGTVGDVLAAAGGSETLTGSGSSGNDVFFGGSGSDLIVASAGQDTIVGGSGTAAIFAGAGADVIYGGTDADYVQAGAGNATLFAGTGANLVGVVDGQAGGSLVLSGFRVGTDRLDLQGYGGGMSGITNSQVVNGSTALTLVDGTHVTLLGVTNLGAGSFV